MDEQLKELARQAGFSDFPNDDNGVWITDGYWDEQLERFAELVRQDEREACAKLCEESYDKQIVHYPKGYYADPNKMGQYSQSVANRCAARIRGRTE
jgi:hypothetical protein